MKITEDIRRSMRAGMLRTPGIIATVNRIAFRVAARHHVLITDLMGAERTKTQEVGMARLEFVAVVREAIVQHRVQKHTLRLREQFQRLEFNPARWRVLSTIHLAVLIGASDHTAVVNMLKRKRLLDQKLEGGSEQLVPSCEPQAAEACTS
jgi:hypothetical protein